ncbi:hypothetical protein CspeluHIS016_0204710 [Cutaneotrichosporon spelunceum]|uniref:Post-SET domain-containing protein n=1 Tax=Cutaneotrichosporon spelunceum TaxID=1672016 RepID=A0AAD3Y9X0_9TREE|nr:hypothetical protein CspeluHIS016_0204710 [Cutaneotrichosporon spelunceum]
MTNLKSTTAAPLKTKVLLPVAAPTKWTKPFSAETYTADHPGSFHVVFSPSSDGGESYSSKLVADRAFAPGERLALLDNKSAAPVKAYSSVQYGNGPSDHLELNSDLLFMNHSCDPSAEMYLYAGSPDRWEVVAGPRGLKDGQDITFFYPSTEWDMAQGFDCGCGAKNCLGRVYGAAYHTLEELEARGLVNDHIRTAKALQAAARASKADRTNGVANGVNGVKAVVNGAH